MFEAARPWFVRGGGDGQRALIISSPASVLPHKVWLSCAAVVSSGNITTPGKKPSFETVTLTDPRRIAFWNDSTYNYASVFAALEKRYAAVIMVSPGAYFDFFGGFQPPSIRCFLRRHPSAEVRADTSVR